MNFLFMRMNAGREHLVGHNYDAEHIRERLAELRDNFNAFKSEYIGPNPPYVAGRSALYGDPIIPSYVWEALVRYAAYVTGRDAEVVSRDVENGLQESYIEVRRSWDDGEYVLAWKLMDHEYALLCDTRPNGQAEWRIQETPDPVETIEQALGTRHVGAVPGWADEAEFVQQLEEHMRQQHEARAAHELARTSGRMIADALAASRLEHQVEAAGIPKRDAALVLADAGDDLRGRLERDRRYVTGTQMERDIESWNRDAAARDMGHVMARVEPLRKTGTRRYEVQACLDLLREGPVLMTSTFRAGASTLLFALQSAFPFPEQVIHTEDEALLSARQLRVFIEKLDPRVSIEGMSDLEAIRMWDQLLGEHGQRGLFTATEMIGKYDNESGQAFLDLMASLHNVDMVIHQQAQADASARNGRLFKGFREYAAPPLSLADTVQALRESLGANGMTFASESAPVMVGRIHDATGGRVIELSYLIGALGALEKRECTVEDFEQVFRELSFGVQKVLRGERSSQGHNDHKYLATWLYERMFQYLHGDDLRTLKRLVDGNDATDAQSIERLSKLGFVTADHRMSWYRINGRLMEMALRTAFANIERNSWLKPKS